MMVPFSAVVMWTFGEKIGNSWKKILWQSGKIDLRVNENTELEIFAEENPPKRVNRPEACIGFLHPV